MNESKLKTASAKIKKHRENLDKTLSDIIQAVFNEAGQEWLKRFPKRKLKLVSGMGTAFWVIDGEILQHDFENGYDGDYRLKYSSKANARIQLKRYWITKRELFLPLLQALEFLGEVLENHESDGQYLLDIDFKNI